MNRLIAVAGIALLLTGCVTASPSSRRGDRLINAIIAEEAAFMGDTRTIGLMPAFSKRAADEAIMFLPAPTRIKPRLATEKWLGVVSWFPAFVTASKDGSLGASIGPSSWEVRGKASPGYYFTVWERRDDGTPHFVFDGSADMPRDLYASRPAGAERLIPSQRGGRTSSGEEKLAEAIAAGDSRSYAKTMHPRGRVLRDGYEPAIGPVAAEGLLLIAPKEQHRVVETHASTSGDLVWTYGSVDHGDLKPVAYFVRVWVLSEDGWRIAVDFRKQL